MKDFSIILPCEENRIPLLIKTLRAYQDFGFGFSDVEFIIPSRTINKSVVTILGMNIKIVPYTWEGKYFSSSLPLNLGVKAAKYNNIIISCPEVLPKTNVLYQLSQLHRGNYVCQVFDESDKGDASFSLVNKNFRSSNPGMYFLACFRKEDLYLINGWDEDFMGTYGFEDDDFGHRFNRAGLKFEVHDEIQAVHQYHPRGYSNDQEGMSMARILLQKNDDNSVISPKNGLEKK